MATDIKVWKLFIGGEWVEMGPLVSAKQRDSVKGFVDRAQKRGGEVVAGGEEIAGKGFYRCSNN